MKFAPVAKNVPGLTCLTVTVFIGFVPNSSKNAMNSFFINA